MLTSKRVGERIGVEVGCLFGVTAEPQIRDDLVPGDLLGPEARRCAFHAFQYQPVCRARTGRVRSDRGRSIVSDLNRSGSDWREPDFFNVMGTAGLLGDTGPFNTLQ